MIIIENNNNVDDYDDMEEEEEEEECFIECTILKELYFEFIHFYEQQDLDFLIVLFESL